MAERTIKVVFFTTLDGEVLPRGTTADLSDGDVERGDSLGAFEGGTAVSPDQRVGGAPGDPGGHRFSHEGSADDTPSEDPDGVVASELTDEQIDELSGDALDEACEQAGIDITVSGSLANGGLSSSEKRVALKAA